MLFKKGMVLESHWSFASSFSIDASVGLATIHWSPEAAPVLERIARSLEMLKKWVIVSIGSLQSNASDRILRISNQDNVSFGTRPPIKPAPSSNAICQKSLAKRKQNRETLLKSSTLR